MKQMIILIAGMAVLVQPALAGKMLERLPMETSTAVANKKTDRLPSMDARSIASSKEDRTDVFVESERGPFLRNEEPGPAGVTARGDLERNN